LAKGPGLNKGIRDVETRLEKNGAGRIAVTFGPHYTVEIESDGNQTSFVLVATHHGVKVDASDVGIGLDELIDHLRQTYPDLTVD